MINPYLFNLLGTPMMRVPNFQYGKDGIIGNTGLTLEDLARLSVQDWTKYAPTTQWRYENGIRRTNFDDDMRWINTGRRRVYSNKPYWDYVPASITEGVLSPGDTIYSEVPEQKRFSLRRPPKKREASTKNPKGNEYQILKRRFEEAWNLAH